MKTTAIKFTAILMILALGFAYNANAQNPNDKKSEVFTAFTLKGNDQVNIRLIKPADQSVTINVFDETHKKVFTKKITKSENLLLTHDISEFPSGVYTYELAGGGEVINSCKVVKSYGSELKYCTEESVAAAKE